MDSRTNTAGLSLVTGKAFVGQRRGLGGLMRENVSVAVALFLGTAGVFGCYGFTYWLSTQVFHCQSFALYCKVSPFVKSIAANIGLVQGFLSTIYDIFLFMMAYAAYRIAETTLWPAMTQQTFNFSQIDRFLFHTRGDMPSFPYALWHARTIKYFMVVLILGLLGTMLQISATIVGWAYTLTNVPTQLYTNHTIGAGIRLEFGQLNPPGPVPQAVGNAYNLYSSWSYGQSSEPLPNLRDFLLDRSNLSSIGEFSVHAVEARRRVNCSAFPIDITTDVMFGYGSDSYCRFNTYYNVSTNLGLDVQLRWQKQLTLWVDSIRKIDSSRAVTRIVFAILGGSIEGGHSNALKDGMKSCCGDGEYCSSISSLACDVDIELSDSRACTGECSDINATLTSLETLRSYDASAFSEPPRDLSSIPIYMAAVPTIFGNFIYGRQPLFVPGIKHADSSFALPQAYSDWSFNPGSTHWSQANLTNFINVTSGALGMTLPTVWQLSLSPNVTVVSVLEMPRLKTERAFVLLVAPLFILACVGVLALLSALMYHESGVLEAKMANTGDIVMNTQTNDIRVVVEDIRAGVRRKSALNNLRLRFGRVADGFEGLSPSARSSAPFSIRKEN